MPMELDWIEDFLALADLGVFSKAAMRRNVTQPAFTRRIRKLEYAVGAVLFDRSVHPVVLTPAGEDFRPTALEMVRMLAAARSRLRSQTAAGEMVAIASLQALAISFLPPLIGSLYAARTPPAIKVMADDMAGCLEALLTGSADILLTYSHPDIITAEIGTAFAALPVAEDLMVAVSAASADGAPLHELDDPRIPYLRYSDESFLGKLTARILADHEDLGARLDPKYQNSMADGLKAAARAGLGVAWLPLQVAADDLENGRLVRISTPAQEARIGITMFRDPAEKSRPVEKLWSDIRRRVEGRTVPPGALAAG